MTEVTQILSAIEQGDPLAAEQLLPLVYGELRKLAAAKLANEQPGQTLQATALVHEAYLRMVDQTSAQQWDGRGHFFSAAAESMRRILVERARRRKAEKHGGKLERIEFADHHLLARDKPDEIVALNDALDLLSVQDEEAAELVKLCVFAGFSVNEAAQLMGMSRATAYRQWSFARAWLKTKIAEEGS
ncbi:ECF-type sigma factor [Novipirellula artificiosorum]|uniref:ECF sigma factor n=1 Tax=Novipirellula artificiosorum TaxID=2528016 RepID=A0A5C6DTJ0_9BACT|nr:ECF-type sigma factor [Novipirellula artificiosorum]TWU39514.1 ECF sigma factor [Novipirellula artificiosorum]